MEPSIQISSVFLLDAGKDKLKVVKQVSEMLNIPRSHA